MILHCDCQQIGSLNTTNLQEWRNLKKIRYWKEMVDWIIPMHQEADTFRVPSPVFTHLV